MDDDQDMNEPVGTMVTALAWVSRGFAKPLLDTYEPTDKQLKKQEKIAGKLKGQPKAQDISQMVKEME